MRSHRRAILSIHSGTAEPKLPQGMTVIDRRTSRRSSSSPGQVGGFIIELLIAGDSLPEVPEMGEPPMMSIEDLFTYATDNTARTWASA
jgi:hypothetical protein